MANPLGTFYLVPLGEQGTERKLEDLMLLLQQLLPAPSGIHQNYPNPTSTPIQQNNSLNPTPSIQQT